MSSLLEQLRASGTVIVCDSSDISVIAKHNPQDATTNPSLILAASRKPEYLRLIESAVSYGKDKDLDLNAQVEASLDHLLVRFGCEILDMIPGKISTEIDAKLSFDIEATVRKARQIVQMYDKLGYDRSRVLIKIAGTWEGIKAAETLQRENINCNVTLIFSTVQAIAAAQAGAYIISPFVGRILDWYTATFKQSYTAADDPGVESVRSIHNLFKQHEFKTIVMGASFRNIGEVIELAGCDYLTIAPQLLEQLDQSIEQVVLKQQPNQERKVVQSYIDNEAAFRFEFNENRMAVEKLREGVSKFASDAADLAVMLRAKIQE